MFVPGLIEYFSLEQISSIFIAVEGNLSARSQYGLLPMADLILDFKKETKDGSDACTAVELLSHAGGYEIGKKGILTLKDGRLICPYKLF
ncbi:MAG: hypothetical protein KAR05_08765 [Candidatus Omnitrophica bacterium]|nr:hypothetical protein [Candidatus Omnitrophota bacterium]